MRRRKGDAQGEKWDFPGGSLGYSEKIDGGMKREIKELLDQNVHDGEDRTQADHDVVSFTPFELQELVMDLFDEVMKKLVLHNSLRETEKVTNNSMELYHHGHVLAYKEIAQTLIRDFDCVSTFLITD